ncbi:MAG: hypothetical protein DRG50_08965 [Deltaproteobacteria bacterium]|nr:MAG: hypothetical protein DRG50_08965 [Deltaproteobacteria bacterium]
MRIYPDCIPCLLKFTLNAAKKATQDTDLLREISLESLRIILGHGFTAMPPQIAQTINRMIKVKTGINDPYRKDKRERNRLAMQMYPFLKKEIRSAPDPLRAALRVAAGGNRMDSVFLDEDIDVRAAVQKSLAENFAIDHSKELKEAIKTSSTLLFLGDNAGEIVFDKVLIEEIRGLHPQLKVIYGVKGSPIIDDATRDDAAEVGMEEVAEVIANGDDAPGTILTQCSAEMRDLFQRADVVMAKGQGNFETLEEERRGLFFLLQVKCSAIAQHIGAQIGDLVLYRRPGISQKRGGEESTSPHRG